MRNLEDYECDGCRSDRGCGECPYNSDRIREWNRKKEKENPLRVNGYGINISD